MALRLSTRISIRWGDGLASEPTDTIVLSVGSYYMDLRVKIADKGLDWALAGTREIICHNPLHCKWYHKIDSRNSFDPDEGTFEKLPNGDDLERGFMPNPENGDKVTHYEEVWRQIQPRPGLTRGWILRGEFGEGTSFLGQFNGIFLAMKQNKNGEFSVRREELAIVSDKPQWVTTYQLGNLDLPSLKCMAVANFPGEEKWEIGNPVDVGGEKYEVCALEGVRNGKVE